MHNYVLTLRDVSRNPDGNIEYLRSGNYPMFNPADDTTLDDHTFRNFPLHSAIDGNSIKVWATQSRLKPTIMKFFFVLRKVK